MQNLFLCVPICCTKYSYKWVSGERHLGGGGDDYGNAMEVAETEGYRCGRDFGKDGVGEVWWRAEDA